MAGNKIEDPTLPTEQHDPGRIGIIIQLIGTKGEWDSLKDGDLTVKLDRNNQNFLQPKPSSNEMQTEKDKDWIVHSPVFHVPVSPSSPGSLGDCSSSRLGFLSPSHQPLASLVKSLSTELELKCTSSLKPRPFISLVKSISTELSRCNPEVSQSKSDSKLNLNLWTQLTQSKGHIGASHTAPPSPVDLSPTDAKTSFFKVELEDTCRKLTEAMHEPLSVFSKIMREDSTGKLKHQKSTGSIDTFYSKGSGSSSGELSETESPRTSYKLECGGLAMSSQPVRLNRKCIHCRKYHFHGKLNKLGAEEPTEICKHEDGINLTNKSDLAVKHASDQPCSQVPGMGLSCVAVLSYCFFILPVSSYWSGMIVGLAFGFMLGLLLIQLELTRHHYSLHSDRFIQNTHDCIHGESKINTLKGWIKEMYSYDPETYHPSLMHSVYATLEGPCIQLDYPCSNNPQWATFNELCYDQSFTHSRRFRLDGSKVFLLPPTLAQKRLWNRKYPICITAASSEEITEDQQDAHFNEKSFLSLSKANHSSTLYLFARTGREKEQWFHQLRAASLCRNDGQNQPDLIYSMSSYDYTTYMTDLISSVQGRSSLCFCHNSRQSNFLCEKQVSDQVAHNIQCKLSKIRYNVYYEYSCMPQITGLFQPQLNIEYTGALHMRLETKINLSKLGKDLNNLAVLADIDEVSCAGSPTTEPQKTPVEKDTSSDLSTKLINPYTTNISNTHLLLTVEIKELSGELVNIPPPPMERIWYIHPKRGEWELTFCHVTEWIEKKLEDEFQKVFVFPNMDDIFSPIMYSAFESQPELHTLLLWALVRPGS
ncbi:hypothetical protein Q7C36_002357 [Tachysurus vachellii]|uniref:Uncharacterized protein n=1 Tax=Tachysurus vachellii TaxID=175792 RepID=A0AA88TGW8_TACVA|nr:hypothetical protein Q7C36_002357 [Tachysurus vachellii]